MLRSRPSTLRARLIALVALAVVPVVGGIFWAGLQQRHYAIEEVEREALALAASAAAEENRLVVETQQLLSVLAQVPQVRRADPAECGVFLAQVMADGNRYANIGVTSPTGRIQCSALEIPSTLDLSFRSWFVRAVQSGTFSVGDYQIGRITGVASLNFGYPIVERDTLIGVLFVALPLTWLQQRRAVADLPAGSDVLVLDGAATVLARYPDEQGWTGRSLAGLPVAKAILAREEGSVAEVTGLDGVRRLYATTVLQDLDDEQPVVVSVGIPTAVAYAPVDRAVARNFALLLAALVLVVGLTWWTSDRLVIRPVNALLLATRRLRDGDLTTRARTTRAPREIEALGSSFNEMAASLQSHVREIEERLAQIRRLNRIRAVLSGINSAIVRIRDRDELLREACRVSVDGGGFDLAWVAELDGDDGNTRAIARSGGGATPSDGEVPPSLRSRHGLAATVLREGTERISNEPGTQPGGREVADLGFRSVAVLPLRVGDRVVAALSLYTSEADFFTEEEVELLQELTADTSLGLAYLEKEKRLDYLANFDPLTDLPNRTLFADRLQQAIGQAREEERMAGVLVVGIDRLAEIHATLGHQAGDQVLRAVAAQLRATIGDTDTAARLGTDQFGLILPGADNVREIERFANDLLLSIPPELVVGDETLFLSIRIGIAAFPHDGEDPDHLVKAAALALGSAGQADPIAFHSAALDEGAEQRRKLEQELRSALARDELAVFYQPVVDLATGRPVGMEALVRWTNPDLGKVSPGAFIPLAEEMGIVGEIGEWVLGTAAREGRRLHEAGFRELRMNVNVAVSQLRDPHFRERFRAIIVDAGIDLARFGIGIEVTESELMENIGEAFSILEEFQQMGLWIYIDDFGTGYSSLSYLRKLPLDSLKIDRSFIQDIPTDPDAVAVVKSIIALSRSLDLRVIAEGIETEEQLAILRELGCDAGQGFLFSRPLAADDLERFLAAHA